MKYRPLGRTGLSVSEVGFGAWGISGAQWIGAQDEQSLQTLHAARDAGVNFFDTALAYGDGHSERLLAKAFGKSKEVIIASKVPPLDRHWPASDSSRLQEVFPREYVLKSLEQSLRNLARDTVDLYQFHVWNDRWAGQQEWLTTVSEMRSSGKARFVGISINDHQPKNSLRALQAGIIDAVQVIYNIFDQSPEDELLPYCAKHGIGVIARVPFDEGGLTGKVRPETQFPPDDFRNVYFKGKRRDDVWKRVQRISEGTGWEIERLPELALRFCLSNPAVSTVIPGMRSVAHARGNIAASGEGPLSAKELVVLKKHCWVRNYYA